MKADLAVFKAFSDETRLRILFLLSKRELCVCEIVAVLGVPQGRISRHLAMLKQAGLLSDRRDSTWIYYSMVAPTNGLTRRLGAYLRDSSDLCEQVQRDHEQLELLACQGVICVPNPVYLPQT